MTLISNTHILDLANELLQSSKYREALQVLGDIPFISLDFSSKAKYYILLSKAKHSLGDYNETYIDKAIDLLRDSNKNELYADAKFVKARYDISKGSNLVAKEHFNDAYVHYQKVGNLRMAADAICRIGRISFQLGEINSAINSINQGIKLLNSIGDYPTSRRLCRNLASIYFMSGKFHKALLIYKEQFNQISSQSELSQYKYFLTYAMSTALSGDFDAAHRLIQKTNDLSAEYKREKANYYEYLGWIYLLEGKYKDAEKTLKQGMKLSLKIAPESALIAQTQRLLADTYLGLGKYELAQKTAEEALIVAEKINERVEIAGCYRVFAQAAIHNENRKQAAACFEKAVEIYKLIQSRYELATTEYIMATCGLFDNGERNYLLYKAKEYFESEDVKYFVEKIDKALKQTRKQKIKKPDASEAIFIAADPKTKKLLEFAEQISHSDMSVVLTGPTGVGKDQLAKYIHACLERKGEFVSLNCAAVPDSMIEVELFGYKKGAFTGAEADKQGLLAMADNGTLYLNEIADSTPAFQAKLLEVLETKQIRKLGSTESRKVNFRVIAATNHDLERMMHDNKFRPDLYHRLNEIPIAIPKLGGRPGDIPNLTGYFMTEKGFDFKRNGNRKDFTILCDLLTQKNWVGNVRELRAEVHRLYLTAKGDIEAMIAELESNGDSSRDILLKTLKETDWNRSETARRLGISEGAVRNRIKKYDLSK